MSGGRDKPVSNTLRAGHTGGDVYRISRRTVVGDEKGEIRHTVA